MLRLDESYIAYLKGLISRIPCTYAELRLAAADRTTISLAKENIDAVSSGISQSGSIRIFDRGAWGFVSFNDIERIEQYALRVKEIAERGERRKDSEIVYTKPVRVRTKTESKIDIKSISFEQKFELLHKYNAILKGHDKVQTTKAVYRDTVGGEIFLNTEGSEMVYEKSHCGVSLSAVAKDGSVVQPYQESYAGYGGFELVNDRYAEAEQVIETAIELLGAEQIEGGKYSVIVDPRLAGVFIHEAFGHLSEADFVYENERMRDLMKLGTTVGVPELNVVDDGSIKKATGYIPLDDEGVEAEKTYLIQNGVLSGRLHSKETAFQMREKPTGNARAISAMAQPIVRMTNTYIENGNYSKEQIFDSIDEGIYAVNAFGGQTNLEMFTFSAAFGRKIKNGKPGKMVKNVMLSGNVFETLKNIKMLGNDMKLFGGLGGCGKGGQSPLPVSFGGPHMRIDNVLIGGAQ